MHRYVSANASVASPQAIALSSHARYPRSRRISSSDLLDHARARALEEMSCRRPTPGDSRISDRSTRHSAPHARIRTCFSVFKVPAYTCTSIPRDRHRAIRDRVTAGGAVALRACTCINTEKTLPDDSQVDEARRGRGSVCSRWHDAPRVSSVGGYFIPPDSLSNFVIVLHARS